MEKNTEENKLEIIRNKPMIRGQKNLDEILKLIQV